MDGLRVDDHAAARSRWSYSPRPIVASSGTSSVSRAPTRDGHVPRITTPCSRLAGVPVRSGTPGADVNGRPCSSGRDGSREVDCLQRANQSRSDRGCSYMHARAGRCRGVPGGAVGTARHEAISDLIRSQISAPTPSPPRLLRVLRSGRRAAGLGAFGVSPALDAAFEEVWPRGDGFTPMAGGTFDLRNRPGP